ncbi:MAG: imelysin family protein, partial [Halioglobus sp.]|nr:imelysin family protein [Halioglobus sp.]
SDNSDADGFDFTVMFANYADNIILPNYEAVARLAIDIESDIGPISTYCQSIGTAAESAAVDAAKTAWDGLMLAIQKTELHILGPAASNNNALSNRLNSSAVGSLSLCGVDQSVVQSAQAPGFDINSKTVTQRGIGALEYLLFNSDLEQNCPSQIVETADWDSRPAAERQLLRCEYAIVVASDIANTAADLRDAWSSDAGDYRSTFINPANTGDSLEELSDALFYLDLDVADRKLAIPIGINDACAALSCPQSVESPYSQYSLDNIRANLQSFGTLMTGGSGLGFDDLIDDAGVPELNQRFADNTAAAIAFIDTASESLFEQASAIDSSAAETECANAYANSDVIGRFSASNLLGVIKLINDDLKIGFVAAIDVDLPDRAQSDND